MYRFSAPMNITFEQKYIYFAIILFFALIAILFYATRGKRIEERGLVQHQSPLPVLSPSQVPTPEPMQNNTVHVQDDDGMNTIVRYDQGHFIPTKITIANETGCFVGIQNASDTDVLVRLGPYNPKQEKGFLYPSIAPHETSLIDPRYGVVTQFSFYNKNNPSAIFTVFIDPTCL